VIEPVDVIRELRQQSATAPTQGAGEAVRFELGPVEVGATVVVGVVPPDGSGPRAALNAGGEVDGER
jgi:hypothetical protein